MSRGSYRTVEEKLEQHKREDSLGMHFRKDDTSVELLFKAKNVLETDAKRKKSGIP